MVYLVFMKKTMVFSSFEKNHGFCQPWFKPDNLEGMSNKESE